MTGLPCASLIMPIHSDPAFPERLAIVHRVAARLNWVVRVPQYDAQAPVFDIAAAIERLRDVRLVIADLTRERPSCYFELGFAEALNKRVRIIAEAGTEIHQTAHRGEARFYSGLDGFETALSDILSAP